MKIGNVELNGQVILAPMAGVCNSAFRKYYDRHALKIATEEL